MPDHLSSLDDPRVTLGIATYNRDTYLAEAIASALAQDYDSLEVLVVVDGSTNPRVDTVLSAFANEPRLRVVRHPQNRGIAAAYNTFVSEGRGELIAMLGDDDVALPGRITRQVEIFDRHPETGVVHGDGVIIDAAGSLLGAWPSHDLSGLGLLATVLFSHNPIVDPTRMVHRRVHETVGGYDARYPVANDLDFYLRVAERFRIRHCPGGPLSAIRRHGTNTSDVSGRRAEAADVAAILAAVIDRRPLQELVPDLDWAVLDPTAAEQQALRKLAAGLERRALPLPELASILRVRADAVTVSAPAPRPARGRLMMTAFGWQDSGGGTTVPRLAAKELARRGWDVTVFYAATGPTELGIAYETVESEEDGVRLIGVHNRPSPLFDIHRPDREVDDPAVTQRFAAALDRLRPDVVHFHNLHNLGAALIDEAAVRGLPSLFSTHNYWLACPRGYLLTGDGEICAGPGDGSRCARCVAAEGTAAVPTAYRRRLAEIRARAESGLSRILAVSDAVAATLANCGYAPEMIDVVRQAMPQEREIWSRTGAQRRPGRATEQLTVAFLGSVLPHKGPQLLLEAAQLCAAEVRIRIIGEVPASMRSALLALDRRNLADVTGAYTASELPALLADVDAAALPSTWWDCAPLAGAECRAARLALLVPRLAGLAELVEDGVDGLCFEPLSAVDLARQIDRLATEPGLLERLQSAIGAPREFSDYIDGLERYYLSIPRPSAPALADRPAVRWQGDHGRLTSLAIVNTNVTARLDAELQRVGVGGVEADPPLPRAADVEVRHQWPPDLSPPAAGALAVILPWEFGSVPADWVRDIATNVDEVWVPSDFVRSLYVHDGVDPGIVRVIPNGVDLDRFTPSTAPRGRDGSTTFLFVGGLTGRKGPDVLLEAWLAAFSGRADVRLIVKDMRAGGGYAPERFRAPIRDHARSGALPRIELIDSDLSTAEMAALYHRADVLVHPYRGEGFAMPVLEAMACGLPVITTMLGPTDEYCPIEAGWRIRARVMRADTRRVDRWDTVGDPWILEPDRDHLIELLQTAANAEDSELRRRGAAARAAAEHLSWTSVAAMYTARVRALAQAGPGRRTAPAMELSGEAQLRVLATPAWRGSDALVDLLAAWSALTTPRTRACLHLLADPGMAGETGSIEARVLEAAAAAGADLDHCADVDIVLAPFSPGRDLSLHRAVDAYVPLHRGCAGQERLARRCGNAVLAPERAALAHLLGDLLASDRPLPQAELRPRAEPPASSRPSTTRSSVSAGS